MVPGGLTDPKPATKEIQEIANKVKSQLEEKENETYPVFVATEYRSQVVAGTNYFIKVCVSNSNNEYVHLRVFQSLPGENQGPSLASYQTGKTRDDPLDYF